MFTKPAPPAPAPVDVVVHKPETVTLAEWLLVGAVRSLGRLLWALVRLGWRLVAWAAPRFPRVTVGVYAVAWTLTQVPLWNDEWTWGNLALIAVNPIIPALGVAVWVALGTPPRPVVEDRRVALWNTLIAADHEASA